jgi:hypothetical protein
MNNTTTLDGKLVRVIDDIYSCYGESEGELIAEAGTVFRWDDSSADQNIDGVLVWIGEDEVEEVKC